MTDIPYRVVDVFTQRVLEGNALAVFPSGGGIDDAAMQKIARELNLSETTFVLPATRDDCVARVRIFTPARELPFAGHPTIGTAYVLRELGMVARDAERFALEEGVGPVGVRVENSPDGVRLWLTTPPIRRGKTYDSAACARALGITAGELIPGVPCELFTAGNPNLYVAVRDKTVVDRCEVDTAALRELCNGEPEPLCLFVLAPVPGGAYSRMFAPELGVVEDPATGSATGPLAAFMMAHGLIGSEDGTQFVSEQGVKMGRRSLLYVFVHGEHGREGIEVGGYVAPVASATMSLPPG